MTDAEVAGEAPEKLWFGHPRALSVLAFAEFGERFAYYGFRALLIFFLVSPLVGGPAGQQGFGFAPGSSVDVFACYVALTYVSPLVGGWLSDRWWGARRAVVWGSVVIAVALTGMTIPLEAAFWIGLLLLVIGHGLVKPSITVMVGDLYAATDMRRDAGFSIFYMAINLGAAIAPIVVGVVAALFGWRAGFFVSGLGGFVAVGCCLLGRKRLGSVGLSPELQASARMKRVFGLSVLSVLAAGALLVTVNVVFWNNSLSVLTTALAVGICVAPIVYLVRMLGTRSYSRGDKFKLRAFIWLFLGACVYWTIFSQVDSTLALFAQDRTERTVGSLEVPAPWFESIEPIAVVALAPVLAMLWTRLGRRAPTTPRKFSMALVIVGLSFMAMVIPAFQSQHGSKAALWWLFAVFVLQGVAELLLEPVGQSATSKLAPLGMGSQLLALWLLANAVGSIFAGKLVDLLAGHGDIPIFVLFGAAGTLAGIAMAFGSAKIHRLMGEVH